MIKPVNISAKRLAERYGITVVKWSRMVTAGKAPKPEPGAVPSWKFADIRKWESGRLAGFDPPSEEIRQAALKASVREALEVLAEEISVMNERNARDTLLTMQEELDVLLSRKRKSELWLNLVEVMPSEVRDGLERVRLYRKLGEFK